ncbi:uncharacterized protein VP01_1259g3 [Puccinia sorghi]|uniref:Ca3427-like PBP 2 domain-containing protein n=1 Tax=Puccinia sorghi TaxID=27349 RepID=A0A0L6VQR4_9BASI|nr:uncharacterized protein VP01_1259g3 [Puccinia sorghi]
MAAKLRVGYVPEHFSAPLLQLLETDKALAEWVELVPNPSGTGQMIAALKDRSIHLAVALTESLIAGIILGKGDYKLIGTYVTSPLNWAVITGANTKYNSIADLKGQNMGISRPGSGSQVMASVMALQQGWTNTSSSALQFVGLLPSLSKSLEKSGLSVISPRPGHPGKKEWNTITLRMPASTSLTQSRHFRRLVGPACKQDDPQSVAPELLAPERLKLFLEKLDASIHKFGTELGIRSSENVKYIEEKFDQKEADVKEWMKGVSYPKKTHEISKKTLEETVKDLGLAGVIPDAKGVAIPDQLVNTEVATVTNS